MADNDRLVVTTNDLSAGQQAASQASRTEFYPGKAASRQNDLPWEADFRIPTGTPAFDGEAVGPVEMERNRIVKLHRGTVSDQTIGAPTVLSTRVEAVADDYINGTHTVQETQTEDDLDEPERLAGNDRIAGA